MTLDRVRQSLRALRRQKRFVATAIACLGVAIALNTTMYSVLDALLKPRSDVRDPEQIVSVRYYGDYKQLIPAQDKRDAFLATTFHQGVSFGVNVGWENDVIAERGSRVREVRTSTVTPNWFRLLGLHADQGRLLDERDLNAPERPVVLGERLWKQLFPEKERFEPATITLGGSGRRVVGIMAVSAGYPHIDIFQLPLPAASLSTWGIARLKPGVTIEQARAELKVISDRFRAMTGEGQDAGWRLLNNEKQFYGDWNFHYALIGSVVAVLLIACGNLANLQLARGVSRARELATRAAVGATRSDIVWQLVLESSWLALGGLVVGGLLTWWGVEIIEGSVPRSVTDYIGYPSLNWRVMAVGIVMTLLCLTLVGLLPALKLSRVDISELMKSGAGTGRSKAARRQYGILVIAEVALALATLCGAGLLVQSAMTVRKYDYSDDFRGLFYGFVMLPVQPNDSRTRRDVSELVIQQALRADSVFLVATNDYGKPTRHAISVYDQAGQPVSLRAPNWNYSVVSPDFFRASLLPITKGRDFARGEFAGAQVIVDSVAARSLWPGREAVGQQLKLDSLHVPGPWLTVVGVTQERRRSFTTDADMQELENQRARNFPNQFRGQVYVLNSGDTARIASAATQGRPIAWKMVRYVARARGDPLRVAGALRTKLLELGPGVRMNYPEPWDRATRIRYYRERHDFMATLFMIFSTCALALAALGVYSIIAHMVAQRTREFGLRLAIGAGERDIRQMVLKEGNVLALSGIAVGLLLTYKTAGWVRAFVFSDWDRYDSRVFAIVAVILFGAAWLASYLPARRAMRINPVEALRND